MSEQMPTGYVWNCYTKSREGDGPLFVAHDDTVTARLDGYAVIPMEEHNALKARIATLEAALWKLIDWAADADLTIYNQFSSSDHHDEAEEITEARAALADAPGEGT